jgi:hypothetical protein
MVRTGTFIITCISVLKCIRGMKIWNSSSKADLTHHVSPNCRFPLFIWQDWPETGYISFFVGGKVTLCKCLVLMWGVFIDPTVKSARTTGIAAAIVAARRSLSTTFKSIDVHAPTLFDALSRTTWLSRYQQFSPYISVFYFGGCGVSIVIRGKKRSSMAQRHYEVEMAQPLNKVLSFP